GRPDRPASSISAALPYCLLHHGLSSHWSRWIPTMSERSHVNCAVCAGHLTLRGPEAHHLATVCRLRRDDPVILFNGDGHEYPGRVVEVSRKDVTVEIVGVETPVRERPAALRVAAPLPKGDRAAFLVEKLTELGVTRFS